MQHLTHTKIGERYRGMHAAFGPQREQFEAQFRHNNEIAPLSPQEELATLEPREKCQKRTNT